MANTTRIELSGGQWAEVKTVTRVADVRQQRMMIHERGFSDEVLDGLDMLQNMLVSWSFGPVDRDTIDSLEQNVAMELILALAAIMQKDDGSGNAPSGNSSTSTQRLRRERATAKEEVDLSRDATPSPTSG